METFEYTTIIDNSLRESLQENTVFRIPENVLEWSFSLWIRIQDIIVFSNFQQKTIMKFGNDQESYDLKIKMNSPQSLMFETFDLNIQNLNLEKEREDFIYLETSAKEWHFLVFIYSEKKISLYNKDEFFTNIFTTNSNLLFDKKGMINFSPPTGLDLNLFENFRFIYSHIHFFKIKLKESDISEIKFYPKKLLVLYKYNNLLNNKYLKNLVKQNERIEITVKNTEFPFKKTFFNNQLINIYHQNKSPVMQNLIYAIKINLIITNIKLSSEIIEISTNLKWFERNTINKKNLRFYSTFFYNSISDFENEITISSNISAKLNSGEYHVKTGEYIFGVGGKIREQKKKSLLAIIKIEDIPVVDGDRKKIFECQIQDINFKERIEFDFSLSYYDQIELKLQTKFPLSLFLFQFDEYLIYSGIDLVEDNNNVFLGNDKKIVLKCSGIDRIFRNLPDNFDKIFLEFCLEDKIDNYCPDISNCKICYSGNCKKCEENYFLKNNKCFKCVHPKVLYNNECYVNTGVIKLNKIDFLDDLLLEKEIILSILIEIPYNFEDIYSNRYIYQNNISYIKKIDSNIFNKPSDLIQNFSFYSPNFLEISYLIKPKKNKNTIKPTDNFGCIENSFKNIEGPENDNLSGNCTTCEEDLREINGICDKVWENCSFLHTLYYNYCMGCKPEFETYGTFNYYTTNLKEKQVEGGYYMSRTLDISYQYCSPKNIDLNQNNLEDNILVNNNYECLVENCQFCFFEDICLVCENDYFLEKNQCLFLDCLGTVENCVACEETDVRECRQCKDQYFLKNKFECYYDNLTRCDIILSIFYETCLTCLQFYFDDDKNTCFEDIYFINNCEDYSFLSNLCVLCEQFFVLFCQNDIFNNYTCICVPDTHFIENCLIYNSDMLCEECDSENNFNYLLNGLNGCIPNSLVEDNCLIYFSDFSCFQEEFDCDICNSESNKFICFEEYLDDSFHCILSLNTCLSFVDNCIRCNLFDILACEECRENYDLINNQCLENVETPNCGIGCLNCNFNEICNECRIGFVLKNGICQENFSLVNNKNVCGNINNCILRGEKIKSNSNCCEKCRKQCECFALNDKYHSYIKCKDDVLFKLKINRQYFLNKGLIINDDKDFDKQINFFFELNDNNNLEITLKISQIYHSKNCILNFKNIFLFQNSKKIMQNPTIKLSIQIFNAMINSLGASLSIFLPNWIVLNLFELNQQDELFKYLLNIKFKGGPLFKYYNMSEENIQVFNIYKNFDYFERKFNHLQNNFDDDIPISFTTVMSIFFYLLKSFIYILFVSFSYVFIHRKTYKFMIYFKEKKKKFIMKTKNFFFTLEFTLILTSFAQVNKYFLFHRFFKNSIISILCIFIQSFINFFGFILIKIHFLYLKRKSNKNFKIFHLNSIKDKEEYKKLDIFINLTIFCSYITFLFRSFLLQNFILFPNFSKIFILLTSIINIIIIFYLFLSMKDKYKYNFLLKIVYEILIFIYIFISFYDFQNSDEVRNVFYLLINIFKYLEKISSFLCIISIIKRLQKERKEIQILKDKKKNCY